MPVLPDGWDYSVQVVGPSGTVTVFPQTDGYIVQVNPGSGGSRRVEAAGVGDALKVAAEAVKALDRLAKADTEYREAREKLLGALGDDAEDTDEEPHVEEPVAAGDLAKHDDEDGDDSE